MRRNRRVVAVIWPRGGGRERRQTSEVVRRVDYRGIRLSLRMMRLMIDDVDYGESIIPHLAVMLVPPDLFRGAVVPLGFLGVWRGRETLVL